MPTFLPVTGAEHESGSPTGSGTMIPKDTMI